MKKEEAIKWAETELKNPKAMTDGGCTFAPDFTFKECCKKHDVMINYNQGITDKEADLYLRECIADSGYPKIAWIYWFWVRFSSMVGGAFNAAFIGVVGISVLIYFIFGDLL